MTSAARRSSDTDPVWTGGGAAGEPRADSWEALVEPVGATDPGLDALRRVRAELGGSMAALRQALASPISGPQPAWAEQVGGALVELTADFDEHVAVTEGSGGLHEAVLESTPRLSYAVRRLVGEHTVIKELVADLLARVRRPVAADEVDAIRERGTALLGRLARHRQHGADLIHQAYQVDLGGET